MNENLWGYVVATVVGLGGYLWKSARTEKRTTSAPTLWTAIEAEIEELMLHATPETWVVARARLQLAAEEAIVRLGLPPKLLRPVVAQVVERGTLELQKRLAIARIPRQLVAIAREAEGVSGAFEAKPASERTVPVLDLDIETVAIPRKE